jgi:molecular chaperone GrpE
VRDGDDVNANEVEGSMDGDEATVIGSDVERLRDELAASQEQYLRTLAEFDNYRKRVERDRDEIGSAGKRDIIMGLLDVVDNFERAVGTAPEAASAKPGGWSAGVLAIYRQLKRLLERHGVTSFESIGEKFDPERHEAIGAQPSDTVPEGFVLDEAHDGYLWNGKLLRPAKVVVSSGPKD